MAAWAVWWVTIWLRLKARCCFWVFLERRFLPLVYLFEVGGWVGG